MSSKAEKYRLLMKQAEALLFDESDLIANLANISALLKETFHFFWIGFYRVENNELVLGPFQGPTACTRIAKGKGVCGTSWAKKETIIVPDVSQFDGHIACSSFSKSEIVVPLLQNNHVVGVLDIDSDVLNTFDVTDKYYLELIAELIVKQSSL